MKRYIHNSMKPRTTRGGTRGHRRAHTGRGEQTKSTKAPRMPRLSARDCAQLSKLCPLHYRTQQNAKRKSFAFFQQSTHKCNHFEKGRFNFLLNGLNFNKSACGCGGEFFIFAVLPVWKSFLMANVSLSHLLTATRKTLYCGNCLNYEQQKWGYKSHVCTLHAN